MEHKNGKTQNKTSSTELSADFDVIVNEINDFIAILEERGQQYQEETTPAEEVPFSGQCSEHSDQEDLVANHTSTESESSSPFASPRNTVICVDFNPSHLPEEPLYEEFEDVKENDYEPLRPKVTAVATADLRPTAKNFEIRPRPDPSKMGDPLTNPKRVKALHNFKGKNNDELCFGKGDIITITQAIEGGWWEGTLNGKTGWFPSNYVKELKTDIPGSLPRSKGTENQQFKRESMQYYHNMVLNNVIETEKTHVQELVQVLQNTIQPIQNSGILTPKESTQLIGNLEDIVAFQNHLLSSLEECLKFPPHQRRVGGIFMKNAPRLKELYLQYCANHPRAAVIIQNKREELSKFLESLGTSNGALALTTNLYKPFTRLDKYPSLLKELERHIDESHIDRGDTQRAIAIYKDISNACMEVRKHKEMEYEILTSAIKGWEGEEMVKLGEVIHLSHVQVSTLDGDKLDRIFVLFPNILVMLSMSPRLSGYQYEGSLPLSGMTATACEEEGEEVEPKSFSISGNMIEKMVVTCTSKWEMTAWVDALTQQISVTHNSGTTKQQSFEISTSQASISTMTKAMTAKVTHSTWSSSCLRPSPPLRQHPMCKEEIIRSPRAGRKQVRRKPVRTHSQDEYDYKCKWRQYDPRTMEEDALILKVIEAYCTSAKTRHTVNSLPKDKLSLVRPLPKPTLDPISERQDKLTNVTMGSPVISLKNPENKEKLVRATIPKESVNVVKPLQTDIVPPVGLLQPDGSVQGINSIFTKEGRLKALFQSPHVLIAEEEKIIVDDGSDPSNLQEKTLVDTVYSLKDQVKNLENEHKKLKRDLDDERMCRLRLENAIRKALKNRHDIPWDENLT